MNNPIILVGNGLNYNRGCEAIARGTQAALASCSESEINLSSGIIVHSDDAQRIVEEHRARDGEPSQFAIRPRLDDRLFARVLAAAFGRRRRYHFKDFLPSKISYRSVLEVGGDNYTLDYGRPYTFLDLDEKLASDGYDVSIWGASIGPFTREPKFEQEITRHFRSLTHIYVRESISFHYLQSLGLSNVMLSADPAILMQAEIPACPGWDVDTFKGAIGLNFSPFQARQLNKSTHAYWELQQEELTALANFAAEVVRWVLAKDDRPVLLIPHVVAPDAWNDDHKLLVAIYNNLEKKLQGRVAIVPRELTASELKWALGQCSIFAGSRTHATLGAVSSGVPTLSFGYSRKATGLMRDLYGIDDMCLDGANFDLQNVKASMQRLIDDESNLRSLLEGRLPIWQARVKNSAIHFLSQLKRSPV